MIFTDVVNEVLSIVKRPDQVSNVRREVNAAISAFCMDVDWPFDLVEMKPALDGTQLTQALALSLFTRFRKFSYIKRGGTKDFLKPLSRQELLQTNCDYANKYYIVGQNVNISLADYSTTLDLGFFQYPPTLTDSSPSFWMLDMTPYMVIDKAASKIFTAIGDDGSAQKHAAFAREAFLIAQKDHSTSTM